MRQAIINQEICPSMRLLWSAGKACRQSNVWAYNCSYIAPTCFQDLGEIMYVSMCGAGLGFAVGAILKFKAHKDNPTQIPVGTPIALLFIAAALLFMPSIFLAAGKTIFGSSGGSIAGVTGITNVGSTGGT